MTCSPFCTSSSLSPPPEGCKTPASDKVTVYNTRLLRRPATLLVPLRPAANNDRLMNPNYQDRATLSSQHHSQLSPYEDRTHEHCSALRGSLCTRPQTTLHLLSSHPIACTGSQLLPKVLPPKPTPPMCNQHHYPQPSVAAQPSALQHSPKPRCCYFCSSFCCSC